jgi:hypothetical protein
MTRSYFSSAKIHLHKPSQAAETLATSTGVNEGF